MIQQLDGGVIFDARKVEQSEYLPHRGVFLAGMLGKQRGDGLGLYFGRIDPGCAIDREIHPETAETVYILAGQALGRCGESELPLGPGQVLHVEKNVAHGLRNVGETVLEFLVIGSPDF